MLGFYLSANRKWLDRELLTAPTPTPTGASTNAGVANPAALDAERAELARALFAATESAIVQILLEICLPSQKEKVGSGQ